MVRFGHRGDGDNELINSITDMLSETDDINIPRILACVLHKYSGIETGHLYYEWLSDHYFSCHIPKIVDNISIIQQHLIRNKHTVKNRGGHGSGDGRVYYIPSSDDRIIQCYEDQNINFVCFYEKCPVRETLHIRKFWPRAGKHRYKKRPTIGMFRKIFKKSSIGSEFPICYGDSRDPGYILSYDSFYERVDTSTYYQGLIRHAMFNIGSQAAWFENS